MSGWRVQDEGINNKHSTLDLFIGKCIGSGASRRVYEILHDPTIVLKIEHEGGTFHNQTEYLIWQEMKGWPISDWFVPCVSIDGYGNCLIQKRTNVFECKQDFHAALTKTRGGVVPRVFADIHYGNFGLYDDRVACHDYGYHHFFAQVAREMSIDAGYITYDEPGPEPIPDQYDVSIGGQFVLL